MVKFTNDEVVLMILYSPSDFGLQSGRQSLIKELEDVSDKLEPRDRWLRKHLPVLLEKLNSISDSEFENLDF